MSSFQATWALAFAGETDGYQKYMTEFGPALSVKQTLFAVGFGIFLAWLFGLFGLACWCVRFVCLCGALDFPQRLRGLRCLFGW